MGKKGLLAMVWRGVNNGLKQSTTHLGLAVENNSVKAKTICLYNAEFEHIISVVRGTACFYSYSQNCRLLHITV